MPKLLERREVYDLEGFPPDLFAKYIKNTERSSRHKERQIRLRVTLLKDLGEKWLELVSGSWTCALDSDFEEEVRRNAMEIFERPISRRLAEWEEDGDIEIGETAAPGWNEEAMAVLKTIRKQVYGSVHPLRRFLDSHYETVADLYDWHLSTRTKYWYTLTNQLIPNLPQKEVAKLTAQDFDEAIGILEKKFLDRTGQPYSEGRRKKFFSNLYSIMEYASDYYGIPNVLEESDYYKTSRVRYRQEPLKKRIEKHLRIRSLDLEEELRLAKEIMDAELEKVNSISPWTDNDQTPVSSGIAAWMGVRPSENGGLHDASRIPFTQKRYRDRGMLLVQDKVGSDGKLSPDLKSPNSYRALPIPKVLDSMMRWERVHTKVVRGLTEEEAKHRLLSSKDGEKPMKPEDLSAQLAKLLRKCLKAPDEKLIQSIPVTDESGELIPMEENTTAYQYRRNFSGMWLNRLGFWLEAVMAALGHYVPGMEGRRWMLYNEDAATEQMLRMDNLILFPIASEADRQYGWEQTDPREDVKELALCGEFQDAAALKLQARPYSEKDRVTVRLDIRTREPSDALYLQSSAETAATLDVDVFFGKKQKRQPLNTLNPYWDKVFEAAKSLRESGAEEKNAWDEDAVWPEMEEELEYIQRQYEMAESHLEEEKTWTLSGDELGDRDMDEEEDE